MAVNWKKFLSVALTGVGYIIPAFTHIEGLAKALKNAGGVMTSQQKEDAAVEHFYGLLLVGEGITKKDIPPLLEAALADQVRMSLRVQASIQNLIAQIKAANALKV